MKLARSIQNGIGFSATHAVGIQTGDLPRSEEVAKDTRIERVLGSGITGNIGRVLKVLLWQPRVYRAYRSRSVSVVAAHNVWVLPLCYRIARRTGAAFVYNPHELETETVAMSGIKQRLARLIERRHIHKVDLCCTVNESISDWYAERYGIARPTAVTNVPVDAPRSRAHLRQELGVTDEEMLFAHTGHLTDGRSIPLILDAFAQLPTRHVVFIGDGPLGDEVRQAAERFPNIHWREPVDPDSVVSFVREADAALCLIEGSHLSLQLSTPNKLFESLASATPVVASDLVEIRRVLGEAGRRWIVEDPHTLRAFIDSITRDDVKEFATSWAGIGTWDAQVAPLVEGYRRLVSSRSEQPRSR